MGNAFNERVIEEFRANDGRVGGEFEAKNLLLLTTTGVRSGVSRTTPVLYLPDGDRLVVFASNGGAAKSPAWYHNLVANPLVTVELGGDRYEARAESVEPGEHDELWRRQVEIEPGFAEFRRRADRVIPLVALVRAA
ncbi:deazaflavin-dependent oxidoreductase (nitroreductase family) [Saccharopolyspora erythraea NRRL 2338]|uniref:Mycobacterium tuberculosis paralogous family 11 n=3 Tax=Saccharopolyspora erythraea TaxID=1836 RepID=A4F948_SACEN|nr:nitroreductase family deazaflavin-dependent oxidoreductase [Saccharopolyspora erythraea]EQD87183.1 hypothetical protein N599_05570 [Saccharopolyspora erythraea D]PFG94365.1 deazaflavin-dependent oxidoreductase (nitroreductase family) [Saccharopolyspora erythraea NRRL 2338]QRK93349.1 nitroreductase family deazaflavin-dependent oxidoreductase [Saccharopolyspora erythraea]CAM00573.1 Mycobacterium tuberculosis paralogous family 11 [Saccharopolyspora erythraea NRRL 2338]